jgi:hypothetical protein
MAMKPWHIYTSNYSKPKSLPKEWNFGKGATLRNAIKYPPNIPHMESSS